MNDNWYALVAASPAPEYGEWANVGIIFGSEEKRELVYVRGLPRLAALVGYDTATFEAMLAGVERALNGGRPLDEIRQQAGPQLRISEPRALYQPLEKARDVLVSELLLLPVVARLVRG